jgi:adenylate cyclase
VAKKLGQQSTKGRVKNNAGRVSARGVRAPKPGGALAGGRDLDERAELLEELAAARQHQAATTEILKTLNRSVFDLSGVLNSLLESAARLGNADIGTIRHREGDTYALAATFGCTPQWKADFERYSTKADRGSVYGRTMLEGRTVHIPNVLEDKEFNRWDAQKLMGFHAALGVPLMLKGDPLGALILFRFEPQSFKPHEIELVESFAEQAVIAIENTRVLQELQEKKARVEQQAGELKELNSSLERRVAEQVDQITRYSKLTRFLSPNISELIMAGEVDDPLRTRRAEITVVQVDLRGFTAFTETADPEEVMSVLREYHAVLGRGISAFDGTIEHFAGDGAMIVFNAPLTMERHEYRAVEMTVQMRNEMADLSANWRKRGINLGFGAGIAVGYATIGTIGFEERLDYSAIGTVCNQAARLCGEAKDGQILVSAKVYAKVDEEVELSLVGDLELKGFQNPVTTYNVQSLRSAAHA